MKTQITLILGLTLLISMAANAGILRRKKPENCLAACQLAAFDKSNQRDAYSISNDYFESTCKGKPVYSKADLATRRVVGQKHNGDPNVCECYYGEDGPPNDPFACVKLVRNPQCMDQRRVFCVRRSGKPDRIKDTSGNDICTTNHGIGDLQGSKVEGGGVLQALACDGQPFSGKRETDALKAKQEASKKINGALKDEYPPSEKTPGGGIME